MEKTKLIQEVLYLAMLVQEKTSYCVFVRYSGHVEGLGIDIMESKKNFTTEVCSSETYTNGNSIERLTDIKRTLLEILEQGKVDFNQMGYEIEEVKHYVF